jgi:hypothetical protein
MNIFLSKNKRIITTQFSSRDSFFSFLITVEKKMNALKEISITRVVKEFNKHCFDVEVKFISNHSSISL